MTKASVASALADATEAFVGFDGLGKDRSWT